MQLDNVGGTKGGHGGLLAVGGAIVVVKILSKLSFWFNLKLSHFMIMLITFAAGIGLMLRSLREIPNPPTDTTSKLSLQPTTSKLSLQPTTSKLSL